MNCFLVSLFEIVKILDKQKKEKLDCNATPMVGNEDAEEKMTELGLTARRKMNTKNFK